ncbi:MAG TPA: MBL fold metallo-hydrolase [Candidatus Sumerlaeota bacterium]|nr:MAG: Ribonuclease [candidate division BRC1 bacterium ADurb.Bin183]HOE64517.1 MBL fold metallo-hydrolase [Candidatus Sumerlaeota bacterium]HRR30056.1 MBL fold metallo-hydrolase [Candidatus Sumerlaeia bacterium]HON51254.1 MBL fold metallo-hydrolase [Candidatus Sumerlaeota bacterium]HOR64429.1 MBL fold metallo-hydrolase [Candidatus Sumerlaeota bacterium]
MPKISIQFLGAAQTTTGSMHMLHVDDKKILLDCGLFQGRREESRQRNLEFPFEPAGVSSLILSHAHIDHCGNIPNLIKKGFDETVFCTSATLDLSAALLRDSAHIQEKDIQFLNKKRAQKRKPPLEPLYTIKDAEESLYNFHSVYYRRPFHVLNELTVNFLDAGHILGSALTILNFQNSKTRKRILFTGDLGRKDMPILKNPEIPEGIDTLIIESTYGNRMHGDIKQSDEKLAAVINRVVARRGKIIVPAFSVGRTQELVYSIKRLLNDGRIPPIPVFVDSPLAVNVTEIFRNHYECYDTQTRDLLLNGSDPFGFETLTYVRTVDQSKALNDKQEPCIIISSSGMCEAGRILHHLKNNIENPNNLILIVGFMATETLGRKIVERQPEVRIFGEPYPLRAEVAIMNEFSAHADAAGLTDFTRKVKERGQLKRIFIVHGEKEQCIALAGRLKEAVGIDCVIPKTGERYNL